VVKELLRMRNLLNVSESADGAGHTAELFAKLSFACRNVFGFRVPLQLQIKIHLV
jgi:hypothetical protein